VRAVMRAVLTRDPLGIWIPIEEENRDWVARVNGELRREHLHVGEPSTMPAFVIRDIAIAQMLKGEDMDLLELRARADGPLQLHPLPDQLVSVTTEWHFISDRSAPNVVGILEGSDPTLKFEYVVFSAHMDHVGVGDPNVWGDSIYNGADDDASGTSTVVEVAEAFASLQPRPRRSIMFVAVSGEEHGLWGSDHFAENPPVPVGQMVANLNVDMVGRNWTDTIVAIGKEHSDLGLTLAQVNGAHPELGMTAIDDLWPEESFYTRSDHYNFARKGVPILFFFNGTHEDYHEPSDELDKIDAEKTARIGRLLFYLGLELADRTDRPRWNPQSYRAIVSP
jgi:Zn-dependent M28 family amino/carboxypeptidase